MAHRDCLLSLGAAHAIREVVEEYYSRTGLKAAWKDGFSKVGAAA